MILIYAALPCTYTAAVCCYTGMFLQVAGVGMSSDEEQEGAGRRGGRMAFTDQVQLLLSAFHTYVS